MSEKRTRLWMLAVDAGNPGLQELRQGSPDVRGGVLRWVQAELGEGQVSGGDSLELRDTEEEAEGQNGGEVVQGGVLAGLGKEAEPVRIEPHPLSGRHSGRDGVDAGECAPVGPLR